MISVIGCQQNQILQNRKWFWYNPFIITAALLYVLGDIVKLPYILKGNQASVCLFTRNNKNTRKRCEISSKLTLKIPEQLRWHCGVFIVNFERISHFVDFEQVNVCWESINLNQTKNTIKKNSSYPVEKNMKSSYLSFYIHNYPPLGTVETSQEYVKRCHKLLPFCFTKTWSR